MNTISTQNLDGADRQIAPLTQNSPSPLLPSAPGTPHAATPPRPDYSKFDKTLLETMYPWEYRKLYPPKKQARKLHEEENRGWGNTERELLAEYEEKKQREGHR